MNRGFRFQKQKQRQKTKDEEIIEILEDLEEDLALMKLTIEKTNKQIDTIKLWEQQRLNIRK